MDGSASVRDWLKSQRSGAGTANCVEVAWDGEGVLVRDSKDPGGPVLRFGLAQWRAFVAGVKDDEFDRPPQEPADPSISN